MKKLVFCIIAALSIITTGNSQTIKSISVSSGFVRTNQNNSSITRDFEPISSYHFAVGASFFQAKCFSLSTDVGLIRKGHKTIFNLTDAQGSPSYEVTDKTYLNYVYLAPRITYKYKMRAWEPLFFIAPRADFFVSARAKQVSDNETPYETNRTVNLYKDNHKKAVLGVNVGAGLQRNITSNIKLGVELIYWLDITKGVEIQDAKVNEGISQRNRALSASFSLKYLFTKS